MTQKAPPKKIERKLTVASYLDNLQNEPEQNRYTKQAATMKAEIESAASRSGKEVSQPFSEEKPIKSSVVAPPKKETRSEVIIVRVTPSLKARATKAAKAAEVPLTEAINQLLDQWINES